LTNGGPGFEEKDMDIVTAKSRIAACDLVTSTSHRKRLPVAMVLVTILAVKVVLSQVQAGIATAARPMPDQPDSQLVPDCNWASRFGVLPPVTKDRFLHNLAISWRDDSLLKLCTFKDTGLAHILGKTTYQWTSRRIERGGMVTERWEGRAHGAAAVGLSFLVVAREDVVRVDGQARIVAGSISIGFASDARVCVCDIRDWFGLENEGQVDPALDDWKPSTLSALNTDPGRPWSVQPDDVLTYEQTAMSSAPGYPSLHRLATFAIKPDTSQPGRQQILDELSVKRLGRDSVVGLVVAEERRDTPAMVKP
jgi:hypothetical protein